jgi:hypothetical protein
MFARNPWSAGLDRKSVVKGKRAVISVDFVVLGTIKK